MPAKRSKVTFIDEERQDLLAVISTGKAAAHAVRAETCAEKPLVLHGIPETAQACSGF